MKFVIAYGTSEGQTRRIAERLAGRIRERGHSAEAVDTALLPRGYDLSGIDGVLVGGSLHAQGYQRSVTRFIRRHLITLQSRPSGFFSVCLSIVSKRVEDRQAAREIVNRYLIKQEWSPDLTEIIAGALLFSRYGFLIKPIMKSIARKEMGEGIDTTRDYEMTDWQAVDRFADRFVALVESGRERVVPSINASQIGPTRAEIGGEAVTHS